MTITSETPPKGDAAVTSTIQRRYDRQAATYDLMEAPVELLFARWRRRLWELVPAGSRVLEVGVGTGKNMRWYPPDVSVTAVDFSPEMLARAARRARRQDVRPQLALMDAQALAFADASFDVAVATCVFCSVPDAVLGLREVGRVLRPGGRLLLLEHVRSGLPVVGRCMDWLNPLSLWLNGVNINRATVRNVERAGFRLLEVDSVLLDIVKIIVAEAVEGDSGEAKEVEQAQRAGAAVAPAGPPTAMLAARRQPGQSRISRRGILRLGFWSSLGAIIAGATTGGLDLLYPRGASGFGGKVSVNASEVPPPGQKKVIPEGRFWLANLTQEEGGPGLLALWWKCTHLGCTVPWREDFVWPDPTTGAPKQGWFRCPCHGSTYTDAGILVFGPAPRPLDTMELVVEKGRITVDTAKITPGAPDNPQRAVAV